MTDAAEPIRAFLRAHADKDGPGALAALDALRALEDAAATSTGEREREAAYSKAIVGAQGAIRVAVKDTHVSLERGNPQGKGYDVAETEQLIGLMREVNAKFGLALEVGNAEALQIAGGVFMRVGFGLRHELGFVHRVTRDFPVQGAGPVFWRQTNTSALGYFIRDAMGLPRLKDESEGEAARRAQSGPRRAAGASPPPAARKATQIADLLSRVRSANLDGLEKAGAWLEEQRFDLANGEGELTEAELAQFGEALKARRKELGA